MALDHDTMINPPIEQLLDKVDSKFTLVTLAARRARNINSYFNQLGEGLGHMIPPQVSSVSRKPLSIAFEEIAQEKIQWAEAPEVPDELEYDAEAEAQAMADAAAVEAADD
jgi:DNA-directed RNA polymerase subunit omega